MGFVSYLNLFLGFVKWLKLYLGIEFLDQLGRFCLVAHNEISCSCSMVNLVYIMLNVV